MYKGTRRMTKMQMQNKKAGGIIISFRSLSELIRPSAFEGIGPVRAGLQMGIKWTQPGSPE